MFYRNYMNYHNHNLKKKNKIQNNVSAIMHCFSLFQLLEMA